MARDMNLISTVNTVSRWRAFYAVALLHAGADARFLISFGAFGLGHDKPQRLRHARHLMTIITSRRFLGDFCRTPGRRMLFHDDEAMIYAYAP